MSCENCMKNEEFFTNKTVFKNRRSIIFFSLNTFLNTSILWKKYCFCKQDSEDCLVCKFKLKYQINKYDIYENCFDFDFLTKIYLRVLADLKILYEFPSHFTSKVINREFTYEFKNYFNRQKIFFNRRKFRFL